VASITKSSHEECAKRSPCGTCYHPKVENQVEILQICGSPQQMAWKYVQEASSGHTHPHENSVIDA